MRIIEETERMALASAEGQALELGWREDNVLDLDDGDYLEMVL
jgi:geranylgeranyl diphosphate synthase, type II